MATSQDCAEELRPHHCVIVSNLAAVSKRTLRNLKKRTITLAERTTIAFEQDFKDAIDHRASEDGWSNWRDWVYMNITKP